MPAPMGEKMKTILSLLGAAAISALAGCASVPGTQDSEDFATLKRGYHPPTSSEQAYTHADTLLRKRSTPVSVAVRMGGNSSGMVNIDPARTRPWQEFIALNTGSDNVRPFTNNQGFIYTFFYDHEPSRAAQQQEGMVQRYSANLYLSYVLPDGKRIDMGNTRALLDTACLNLDVIYQYMGRELIGVLHKRRTENSPYARADDSEFFPIPWESEEFKSFCARPTSPNSPFAPRS